MLNTIMEFTIAFLLTVGLVTMGLFGFGKLMDLYEAEQNFDRAQISYELELAEEREWQDQRKVLHEANR